MDNIVHFKLQQGVCQLLYILVLNITFGTSGSLSILWSPAYFEFRSIWHDNNKKIWETDQMRLGCFEAFHPESDLALGMQPLPSCGASWAAPARVKSLHPVFHLAPHLSLGSGGVSWESILTTGNQQGRVKSKQVAGVFVWF